MTIKRYLYPMVEFQPHEKIFGKKELFSQYCFRKTVITGEWDAESYWHLYIKRYVWIRSIKKVFMKYLLKWCLECDMDKKVIIFAINRDFCYTRKT